ncbi:MAG: helical backbone metal receptor [Betaproteobacteria bacterium]
MHPAESGVMLSDPCKDWAGTRHSRVNATARIACLVPSITELLFALDLGPQVVARTGFCVHPRDAVRRVPKIGGTKDPDLSRLRTLSPTHLVVNVDENRREVVDAARAFVPNIIVTHPQCPEDNVRLYRLLGAVFDRDSTAARLGDALTLALDALRSVAATLPREPVIYLIWKKPWMSVAAPTYIGATLAAAGWDVVAVAHSAARYPTLADDDTAWASARRILVSSEPFAFRARDVASIAAARNRPAHLVDGEMTSWYGPRAIAGLRYLADLRREIAQPSIAGA